MENQKLSRLEKCEHFKAKGYIYDPQTGAITSPAGKIVTAKSAKGFGIIGIRVNGKNYHLRTHDFAFYFSFGYIPHRINHLNDDNSDDRIINLQETTHQENCFKQTGKGYVYRSKEKKYQAQITVNGKLIYLGLFDTPEAAHKEYLSAKKTYQSLTEKPTV